MYLYLFVVLTCLICPKKIIIVIRLAEKLSKRQKVFLQNSGNTEINRSMSVISNCNTSIL